MRLTRIVPALALALVLALGAGRPSHAATIEGVNFPDTYQVDGTTLVLNGLGLRTLTIFQVEVYVAALYLAAKSQDPVAIEKSPTDKVLILHYLHGGSKEQVEKEYRLGEQNNCGNGGCSPQDGADFEKLVALAPAVEPGDTTTYIFKATGFSVLANGKPLASFNNPDLGFHILDGFIGAHPPSPALRAALLGTK